MPHSDRKRNQQVGVVCTLDEKLLLEKERSDMQLHEGRKMSLIEAIMYLFFLYEKEHKLLDQVRKQIISEFEGDVSGIDNEYIIMFLYNEYRKHMDTKSNNDQNNKEVSS